MGLYQQVRYRKCQQNENESLSLAEWDKHNRLQGFMTDIFWERGADNKERDLGREFNGSVEIELFEDDLDLLEEAIKNRSMPQATGLFFGEDSFNPYDYEQVDRKFIADAREKIKEGYSLYYNCSH